MSKYLIAAGTAAAALLTSTAVHAGGIERSVLNVSPLFEEGRYLEFSFSSVSPDLTGVGGFVPAIFGGPFALTGETNDLLKQYLTFGLAYKADINDRLSYALIVNQPYGADTDYGLPAGTVPDVRAVYGGSFADLDSYAVTALIAYDATPNVKVYGGPVFQSIEAEAALPFIPTGSPLGNGYSVVADRDWGTGFVVGAAYEKPEIALRVALTYRSAIDHDLSTTETLGSVGGGLTVPSQTNIETPQSVTLDFRTGVAPKTAVFGQINWVDWSEFDISPPNYPPLIAAGRPLVNYSDDWWTYTVGVARRIDENWVGLASVTYEPQIGTELTSLGPVDGRTGINLGAIYETDKVKITGGINYSWIGETFNVLSTDYDDGTSIGIGFRVGLKL
ncbi:OmpP1/FadL family transporter [Ovoidimarina sediminis]|uniref:OmpP1/FadL family transporter n=1 Tax=Ovoidimarina sediminis TaxID=3079856 RepID=UPI00290A00A1|nr:outer membrane protein transport protein [Rhodophyticola sp. MJ-SS7]MDU8945021.1 outer membrane protein transport protein [Rhodophyticola sp. MJ-SS7]